METHRSHSLPPEVDLQGFGQQIFQYSLDAMIATDAQHRIVLWNPAAERLLGYSSAQAYGQPIAALIPLWATPFPAEIDSLPLQSALEWPKDILNNLQQGNWITYRTQSASGQALFVDCSAIALPRTPEPLCAIILREHCPTVSETQPGAASPATDTAERMAYQVMLSWARQGSLPALLQQVARDLAEFLQADGCLIQLVHPEYCDPVAQQAEYRKTANTPSLAQSDFYRHLQDTALGSLLALSSSQPSSPEAPHLQLQAPFEQLLYLPLLQNNTPIGALALYHCSPPVEWEPARRDLLPTMGAHFAHVIQATQQVTWTQAQLEKQIQQQQVLTLLSQHALMDRAPIDTPIGLETPAHSLQDLALQMACNTLNLTAGRIVAYQPESPAPFRVQQVLGPRWQTQITHALQWPETGLAQLAIAQQQPAALAHVCQPDAIESCVIPSGEDLEPLNQPHLPMATLVIYTAEGIFGVLEVGLSEAGEPQPPKLSGADIRFLQSVANILGIAIGQAQAEQRVAELENRYQMILEASGSGLWDWNLQTGEIFWSDSQLALLGLQRETFTPTRDALFQLIHPADRDSFQSLFCPQTETCSPYEMEVRIRHVSGEYLYLLSKGHVFSNSQGEPQRIFGMNLDMTDRRKYELQLKESEERFRAMADDAPFMIWMTGSQGEPLYFNKAWYEFVGLPPGTLEINWSALIQAEDLEHVQRAYEEAWQNQTGWKLELRMRRHDGMMRTIYNVCNPRHTADGQFIGHMGCNMDVTEQRQAVGRYLRVSDSNLLGIVSWRLDGVMIGANEAFLNLVGYTRANLEKGDITQAGLTPPEYASLDAQALCELQTNGACKPFEKQIIHKDGHRIDVLIAGSLLDTEPPEVVGYILDISKRKHVERTLEWKIRREALRRQILEKVGQSLDLSYILQVVAEELAQFYQADRCLMVVREPHTPQDEFLVKAQFCARPTIQPIPEDEALDWLQPIWQNQTTGCPPHLISHAMDMPAEFNPPNLSPDVLAERRARWYPALIERYQIQHMVHVCASHGGRLQGIIWLQQSEKQGWNAQELELLQDVAHHIGGAIWQTELYRHEQATKEQLERSAQLIHLVNAAQNAFITQASPQQLWRNVVQELLAFTQCEVGLLAELTQPDDEQPTLVPQAICRQHEQVLHPLHRDLIEPETAPALWQALLQQLLTATQQPIGIPFPHEALYNFMMLPLYQGEQLVGLIGLANRPEGFSLQLAEALEPALTTCANLILGFRNEAMRAQLTDDLRQSEISLQTYAAKLESSNRELEDFATIASHDLQAPLRKVAMFSQYLKSAAGTQLSNECLDYIARIERSTQKMQSLISDLLALSRVRRRGESFRPVALETIIREVLYELEEYLSELQGQVMVEGALTVDADAIQMHQLFQNLIGNALKFHRPGVPPQVRIQLNPPREAESQFCQILITDNGIGFEDKYNTRIFEVFERLHGDAEYEGTGMGLAIVKKIVERHGGRISAHGQPFQGAQFLLELPCVQATAVHSLHLSSLPSR